MRYWIAAQSPPLEGSPDPKLDRLPLAAGREVAGRELAAGDLVLVYQSRSGRAVRLREADGTETKVHTAKGRQGIVALVEVTGPIAHHPEIEKTRYVDGTELRWCFGVPIDAHSVHGHVPLSHVNRVLGFKATYNFGGFAYRSSGLREIEDHQYRALVEAFRSSAASSPPLKAEVSDEDCAGRRLLVDYVAADPTLALGEPGLQTLVVARDLPAGDSADVVLEDRAGAVVAVQVDAEEDWLATIAHASVRRAMLEHETGRRLGESRAIVVAYSVPREMRELCASYGIETCAVDRDLVSSWNGPRSSVDP